MLSGVSGSAITTWLAAELKFKLTICTIEVFTAFSQSTPSSAMA